MNQSNLPPPMTTLSTNIPSLTANNATLPTKATALQHDHWFWLAMSIAILWVMTLIAWWLFYTRNKVALRYTEDLPRRQLFASAKRLAENNDATAFSHQLLRLAQNLWPNAQIHQLGDIKVYLDDAGKQVIDTLNQQLYHHSPKPWNGMSAWRILKPQLSTKHDAHNANHHLPPIYPKDNHETRH
jgi:hypothetical protein